MLSARERAVLELTATGEPAKRIAPALGISVHTVIDHKESAREKLGAANITHAVALALKLGLIEGPPVAGVTRFGDGGLMPIHAPLG